MNLFLEEYKTWSTPDGTLWARVHEEYLGRQHQVRICLVDSVGRVYHYDRDQVIER